MKVSKIWYYYFHSKSDSVVSVQSTPSMWKLQCTICLFSYKGVVLQTRQCNEGGWWYPLLQWAAACLCWWRLSRLPTRGQWTVCSVIWACLTVCLLCHLGLFNSSTVCLLCHLGLFNSSTVCLLCHLGLFNSSTVCLLCHLGLFNTSMVCLLCHLGLFNTSMVCLLCRQGLFNTSTVCLSALLSGSV